ncbi:MAG: TonB-dependent receptor [Vicinamibacteria bacterium]|nr:TonB-dependent receptor [Vicinamibacteria bacterium]
MNVRPILPALAFGLATLAPLPSAGASESLVGRVITASSRDAVVGATISLAGYPGQSRTDADGRFSWASPPAPPFQLIVVLGSGQVMRPFLVERILGELTIPVSSLADESVTVLGAAPSVATAPASGATLLSGAQVAQRNPENLMEALETVPGVSRVSEGHSAVPALRGMARGRTLLLLDGGRVSAERRVGPSASFLDPSVVGSVDVARGPASVAYGSDAFGGVISVKTRRAEPGSPLRGSLSGTLGTGVPEARGSIELSKGLARGGFLIQGHVRSTGDYDSPLAEVFNSGWSDSGFVAGFTHEIGRGAFAATWQSDFGRDVGRPRNNSRTVRFHYPFENSHRFTTSYDISKLAGFEEMSFTGFLGTYEQRTDQDRLPTATTGRSVERADISARDFHVKTTGKRVFGSVRSEVGIDVNGRFGLHALDVIESYTLAGSLLTGVSNVAIDDSRRTDAGVFAQVDVPLGARARVAAGVRADRVTTRNVGGFFGDRDTSNGAGSGFGSLTVGPFQGFSATAQLSRGFRDPVLSDRYYRGPSGRGFITGNPGLVPETSLQTDLALRYTRSRVQIAVYAYQYRIDDLVERFQTQTDFFFFRNRGRARLRGLELESRVDLGHGTSIELFAQAARGRALDDNAFLDDASPDTLSLVARKEFGTAAWVQARLARYAEDDRPGPTEVVTPGYTILDLGGGWKISKSFEARAMARNLLDEEYRASPDSRFVLAPGRSISGTVTLRF